jgi:hypothetical protein
MAKEIKNGARDVDILSVTKDFLKGRISYEEYHDLENLWYDNLTGPPKGSVMSGRMVNQYHTAKRT